MRTYLDPTAPIAANALLTDDPKAAMDLAVALTDSPRMSNLAHGLWGYHGTTPEGLELTIQALGIGGASASAVVSDLARLGVERAIRIGSCIAIGAGYLPGSVLVAGEIEAADGAGRALFANGRVEPDQALTSALLHATGAAAVAPVRSVDLYPKAAETHEGAGVLDLSSASVVATGARDGVACACALVVSEAADGLTLGRKEREESLLGLGAQAGNALAAMPQASGF